MNKVEEIEKTIKVALAKKGLKQKDLANHLGIQSGYLFKSIRKGVVSTNRLYEIYNFLGIKCTIKN